MTGRGMRGLSSPFKWGISLLVLLTLLAVKSGWAEGVEAPSFGKGKIQVRLYTDYFCGPCSRMEPKIEGLLSDLVKRDIISLTFVDTPVHRTTQLYAQYFLEIVGADRSLTNVLRSRAVLFDAAKNKIEKKEDLEEFLKKNGVKFVPTDPRPVFVALSALISEDDIKSTPTCVIVRDGKKGVFSGEKDIMKALEVLD
jgi:thiol-disulfide isomerase/thioredoxin